MIGDKFRVVSNFVYGKRMMLSILFKMRWMWKICGVFLMFEEWEKRFLVLGKCLGRNGFFEKEKGNCRIVYFEKLIVGDFVVSLCFFRKEYNFILVLCIYFLV